MTGEGTGVFLTDDGDEFSVRSVQHHTATATTTLEPLYATDVELMNGVTGQLRVPSGQTLRGTLRQRGNVFVLLPEQKDERVLEQTDTTSTPPPAPQPAKRAKRKEKTAEKAPVAPPAPPPVEPAEPSKPTAPSPKGPIEAPTTDVQVRRDDSRKAPEKPPTKPPAVSPVVRVAKPKESVPESAPVAPPPPPRAEPAAPSRTTTPSQAEAIEALKIVAQFLRGDVGQLLEKTQTTSHVAFPRAAPSQVEAIEAARAVAQFLRDDPSVDLELAKQAQEMVSEFIAERERKIKAGDN